MANHKQRKKAAKVGREPVPDRLPLLAVQDIVDWLLVQHESPHPMRTNVEVMLMWLEAMETGLSHSYLRRRVPAVMQRWREVGDRELAYTQEEQENHLRRTGPDMAQPVITISWQQFKQAKDLQCEVDEQLTQSLQQTAGEKENGEDEDE